MRGGNILLLGCAAALSLTILARAFYVEHSVYENGSLEPVGTQTVGVQPRRATVVRYVTSSANEKLQQAENVELFILVPWFIGLVVISRRKFS